jgi:hypothetical protein
MKVREIVNMVNGKNAKSYITKHGVKAFAQVNGEWFTPEYGTKTRGLFMLHDCYYMVGHSRVWQVS